MNTHAQDLRADGPSGGATPRVYAVTSGKGGVGKTNIVGNLAVLFTRMGKRVLILDADLGLANIDVLFGIHPDYTIQHVISGEKTLNEVMVETDEGIRVIPAGSGFTSLTSLTDGQKLHLMSEFEQLGPEADIVLIDTGAGISDNVIYFNLAAEVCIVVVTGEPTSITDAYAIMKIMSMEHGTKRFKLVVNMIPSEKEAKAVYESLVQAADRFLDNVAIAYMGCILQDDYLRQSVLKRTPVTVRYPEAPSSEGLERVAERLLRCPRKHGDGNPLRFFITSYMDYRDG
ncbi:MAG: flagellar synthesis regulator FleN [Deltaproteobacteria bacterium]|nr:MAG: flagellar synthesis regulator FleN [Deltaproteobacteria bacterium]